MQHALTGEAEADTNVRYIDVPYIDVPYVDVRYAACCLPPGRRKSSAPLFSTALSARRQGAHSPATNRRKFGMAEATFSTELPQGTPPEAALTWMAGLLAHGSSLPATFPVSRCS